MNQINEKLRLDIFSKAKRVVIKVGTNVIADDKGLIDRKCIEEIAVQIAALQKSGHEVVLVSSGAIGSGLGELNIAARPKTLSKLQAVAAVGQCALMREYYYCFKEKGVSVAQVLLVNDDLKLRSRHVNVKNTISTLFEYGVVPIVNENDTVSVEEIKFGDNDRLSALVANLIKADVLIILSNVDGLIDYSAEGDKVVSIVESINKKVEDLCMGDKSRLGTGGMKSKLIAAKIVNHAGEAVVIANGTKENVITDIFKGKDIGTLFLPRKGRMAGRKRWIAFFVVPSGVIVVDDGAEKALKLGGKSLLASGVVKSRGFFKSGDNVSIENLKGVEFARGIVRYSSKEIEQIKGLKTDKIAEVLGRKTCDEIIHRDDLVIL